MSIKFLTDKKTGEPDGRMVIDNVRARYLHVFRPWGGNLKNDDGKDATAKFQIVAIIPRATREKDIVIVRNACLAMAKDKLKVASLPGDRIAIKNGNLPDSKGIIHPEFENAWILAASEAARPLVCGHGGSTDIIAESDGILFPGCYVNVTFSLWASDHKKGGKRILANLLGVQFVREPRPDEPAFGRTRGDMDDAFEEVSAEGEEGSISDGLDDPLA